VQKILQTSQAGLPSGDNKEPSPDAGEGVDDEGCAAVAEVVFDWLQSLRQFLKGRPHVPGDPHGGFPPECRYNMDEVGFEPFPDRVRTVVRKGSKRVLCPQGLLVLVYR